MRIGFSQVFQQNSDGTLEPVRPIQIGGVRMGPGVKFARGVKFGGIDIFQYFGHDFEATKEGNVLNLISIYTGNAHIVPQL